MIKKENLKLLRDKKRSLLIQSETIKDYPTLYKFILKNQDITEELIESQLTDEDKRLINNLLPNILKLCQDEWKGDDTLRVPVEILDGNARIPCSLCGTDTKKIFYITNKISGRKLNVGSICIDEFAMESLKDGKTKSQLLKEAERNLALKQLNNNYPGIEGIVETWSEQLNSFELLIPLQLEEPYLTLGTDIRTKFNDYLNGSNAPEIETFQILLDS